MDPIWLWVVAAVVCGIIEVLSVSFVFLMLGVGALAGRPGRHHRNRRRHGQRRAVDGTPVKGRQ